MKEKILYKGVIDNIFMIIFIIHEEIHTTGDRLAGPKTLDIHHCI